MADIPDRMDELPVEGEGAPDEDAERRAEERLARLDAFGQSLAKTRSEAIDARVSSGIEDIWLEDEEFYEGIDDANRSEDKATWRQKPPGQAAVKDETTTRSTVFPNITGPYVEMGAARIADMLLPTDDRSWGLGPTPVPDLIEVSEGRFPPALAREAEAMYPGRPEAAQNRLAQAVSEAAKALDVARQKADRAQKRIEDWHVECQWHAQVRMVIEDAARIGVGVLKGPVPTVKRRAALVDGALTLVREIKPGSKWIDPWNFYPDPSCGENIHNGGYTWECDSLTRKQLRELKDQEDYIGEQIDRCLAEGPAIVDRTYRETPEYVSDPGLKDKFRIWYYHGVAEREDIEAAGCECEDGASIPVMVTMVNNRVVKVALNPLDTGEFPYDVMVWRRRAGHWTGIGIAREIRTPQRMITAATRNLMDNAGLAAGPMLVYMQGKLEPANGKAVIAPRKVWAIAEDAEGIKEAIDSIGYIKIDMMVAELRQIIDLGLLFAEHVTGMPMLLQGQQGRAPDTVGGMQILNNNATAVLRRLARLFDDRITEPHVRRYYHWLLMYGEDEEKGDYCIDARGSSALVERDIQNQELVQVLQMSLNPVFGKDPIKAIDEYLKSRHFDPKRFDYDDEKWRKIVENMAKGPQDPRLAVAQLREASEERERETKVALTLLEQRFEEQENSRDRELDLMLAGLEAELERGGNTDTIKAKLADTVMKLRTQVKLSREANNVRQLTRPPTEPKGRAPAGQAFQR